MTYSTVLAVWSNDSVVEVGTECYDTECYDTTEDDNEEGNN